MTTSFDQLRNRAFNKRFLLMLLVTLVSVAGTWAQNSGTDGDIKWVYDGGTETLTFSSVDPDSDPVAMPDYEMYQHKPWNSVLSDAVTINLINISRIGQCAFCEAGKLTSVIIPNTVTCIGPDAFAYCESIRSITLPNTITNIDGYAFSNCRSLTSIEFPSQMTSISMGTFDSCTSLTSITIPANITTLGSFAFSYCAGLTSITVEGQTPPFVDYQCFCGVDKSIPVFVPCGKGDAYRSAEGWSEFTNIVAHQFDNSAEPGTPDYYTCSVCGYIDEVRKHVHNYSQEWTITDTHHRHECVSGTGTCTAKFIGEEHHYNSSINNDAVNYTCDVCGYVNETLKAPFDARDYMSMTAKGGNVVVGAKKYDDDYIPSYVIQYSQDRVNWTNYAVANDGEIVTIPEGETYYFRSGMPYVLTSVMDKFWNFTMTGSGTIEAGGNVMSLLDRSCQSLVVGEDAFRNLFDNCTLLTVAPEMPATTLGEWCYTEMFNGCTQLQKAPHLPAAILKYECYGGMFDGCSSLDYVEADFTDAQPGSNGEAIYKPFQYATDGWLNCTAANGLLVMKREMIEHGFDNGDKLSIPSGWQRALKVKANEDPNHKGNFYTTFYDGNYSFDVIGEAKAYSGSIEGDELRLTPTTDNRIPRYDGVLLHGTSADIVVAIHSSGAKRISGNILTGSNTAIAAPDHCYILSYGQNGLGFYQYAAGKALSAHKAYLVYDRPAGAKGLRMVFEDEKTGIENINDDDTLRYDNDNIYSVSGIRLNKLQKGINIVNGKKVVIK